jgi:hypothetical protein
MILAPYHHQSGHPMLVVRENKGKVCLMLHTSA